MSDDRLAAVRREITKANTNNIPLCFASQIATVQGYIHSGTLSLDMAMGGRGYPYPKIIEIYGPPSTGKSILTIQAAAKATQDKKLVIWYDGENNYNSIELNAWRLKMGVNGDYVIHIPQMNAEDVINQIMTLLKKFPDDIQLVVIDSASSFTTEKLLDKQAGEGYIDETPKLLNTFCKKMSVINRGAAIIVVSHIMSNIGSYSSAPVAKGGYGIKFFASLRLEIKGGPIVTTSSDVEGARRHSLDILVKKNKINVPAKRVKDLIFDFDSGVFDKVDELITLGHVQEIIKHGAGGWYSFVESPDFKAHGRENFKQMLNESPQVIEWLFQKITGTTTEEYGW